MAAASRSFRCRRPSREISLRDAGRGARAAQADEAEALCGAALRRAARPDPLLRRDAGCRRRSGCPTASMSAAAPEFVAALGRLVGTRAMSVIEGGLAPALALAGAENTAGALTVKVLRSAKGGAQSGVIRGLDLKGLPLGEVDVLVRRDETETEAALTLPVEIRNDVARLDIAAERSAGAVQLLDKRWRRRAVGVVTGATADTAQPLLGLDLLSDARAQSVRRRAAGRSRLGGAGGQPVHGPAAADDDPRRRRQCRGSARAADQVDRGRRRAGALRRSAARRRRRRSHSGQAAPRRTCARRRAELGPAAAARCVLAREPVLRHAGTERRDREPAGAGRARRHADRPHLGDARRRHAAGHRAAARQGHDRPVPRQRRHPLVEPAAVGRVRGHAQAHRLARRLGRDRRRRRRARADAKWCRRPASSTASACSDRRRRTPGRSPPAIPAAPPSTHPPGFYGPPEGLLAVNTLAPDDRLAPLDLAGAQCAPRRLPRRASRRTCAVR